jgi:GGDEF domain-containing protein
MLRLEMHNGPQEEALPQEEASGGKTPARVFASPVRIFLITLLAIFLGEAFVMFLLRLLPPLTPGHEAFVDSLMLVFIVFPVMVFFVLKPMRLHVAERKRVEEKLRTLSITDELTGLLNRRGFFVLAEQQLSIAHRHRKKMVLETAAFLKENFRRSDITARMGGDEFVIMQVEDSDADALGTRLEEAFDREVGARYRKYRLSISTGSATYEPESPRSLDDLLAAADAAIYENKLQKAGSPPD